MYAQQPPGLGGGQGVEEDPFLAANRHSLVEKIGELAASAHALGEGQFPFPFLPGEAASQPQAWSQPQPLPQLQALPAQPAPAPQEGEDVLVSIRRGVRLRRAVSNDRSAPRILW